MGNNNLKTTNDILIKVDHNNLIYIDPNSVLVDGMVTPRAVEPENLVMYVNLEADLVPRSILIANDNKNTLTSIAQGTINFMQNKNGKDYDTTWTNSYYDKKAKSTSSDPDYFQIDETAQSFGIESISIKVMGANFIPRVDIKFVDVRGKTLFESPENSPYAAFFHIPWPLFYLTVKGYYGKAIRYRLHLIKFNSKYNSNNGNFEIQTNFIGSTYAYLADISLEAVLNAPYLYFSESSEDEKYNEKTGQYEQIISKTTKGYRILRSVYQEYKNKGYIPKDFPIRTLREVIILAGRLDKIFEKVIFGQIISHHTLAGVKEYEKTILEFKNMIKVWGSKNLSSTDSLPTITERIDPITNEKENVEWFILKGNNKSNTDPIEALENIININVQKLESNYAFGTKASKREPDHKDIKLNTISCSEIKNVKRFYTTSSDVIGVDLDGMLDQIDIILRAFIEQRNKLESDIERIMNLEISNNPDFGLGFEPKIRNIIAVLLANAETYIRLMRDVHEKAFNVAAERKKLFQEETVKSGGILSDGGNTIFPWPEVKLTNYGKKEMVLVYPGSREMELKLRSYDKNLWPEVDFVEEFSRTSTKVKDNLSSKEGSTDNIHYVFGSTNDSNKRDISVLTNIMDYIPYTNKSMSSIIYEIFERSKYTTSLNPFDSDSIRELADVEYLNLKEQMSDDIDIVETLKKNITTYSSLISEMESILTKYPYYLDQLPTIDYIKDGIEHDFSIKEYNITSNNNTINNNDDYLKVSKFLNNYQAENYRKKIYPFNSSTYTSYLNSTSSKANNFRLNGILQVNTPNSFISSPIDSEMWIKDGFTTNIFSNKIKIGETYKHILNTPYFHKQLYNDFIKTQSLEKYTGSAYLLLNSIPYKDLSDTVTYTSKDWGNTPNTPTLLSNVFREIGSSHIIPYHMMLKWGSIYHRYKKYLIDGIDIIDNITEQIDGNLFFDNNSGYTFNTISSKTVTRSNEIDVGFHPYYETVFHQIVNGYGFLNINSPVTNYSELLTNEVIKTNYNIAVGVNTWTTYIDNSKFDTNDTRYTLLPTNGFNNINGNNFALAEQENFRILWGVGTEYTPGDEHIRYNNYNFPSYKEYIRQATPEDIESDEYSLTTNYRKVIDLIATFKPEILDEFELAFLDFASEKLNESTEYKPYNVRYTKFQDLLKEMVSVSKDDNYPSNNDLYTVIKDRQTSKLIDLTTEIKSFDNMIKISLSNPREVNDYLLGGFTNTDVVNFSVGAYNPLNLPDNLNNIELYLGEDIDGYYSEFFSVNNIDINEENIKQFRPLIYLYAGLREEGENPTNSEFIEYIKNNITDPPTNTVTKVKSPPDRLIEFLDHLIYRIKNDLELNEVEGESSITRGHNDDPTIKLESYNYFKSFNDKWTSGNSIGQRSLIEEFLFLDRANRDIGDEVYIDLSKLMRLGLTQNVNINLFSAISLLVQDTGFDIRPLPAYINFYGKNISNASKIIPSSNVARNMFGSFLDIDYEESSPKIILQYIGPSSKHPELSDISKKRYLYDNDGFDIGRVNGNPIIVAPNIFENTDFTKSNKVVAFEVSFGDQNQSIFKGVELDQSTIRNTSESFYVTEMLAKSEGGGGGTAQVDIGLWNIYRQAAYQCQVTCMGNVMIQPTMYFYLKNIPLFRGSYWITEVSHNITEKGIETTFKGTRIPQRALPDPEDSFLTSYRPLFDKMIKRAVIRVKEENKTEQESSTEQVIVNESGSHPYNMGSGSTIPNEVILKSKVSVMPYGIPYNGFDGEENIQLVKYKDQEWLRAVAIEMDSSDYDIDDGRTMDIITRTRLSGDVRWREIKNTSSSMDFYETKFKIKRLSGGNANILTDRYTKTEFVNPRNSKSIVVDMRLDHFNKKYSGPVAIGPTISKYGIGLSKSLMTKLGLWNNQVVYFRLAI